MESKKEEQKIVTKVDILWYTLFLRLEEMQDHVSRMGDNVLSLLCDALMEYVDNRISLPERDIEDYYVVIEQSVEQ